jgi:hypothetical protein
VLSTIPSGRARPSGPPRRERVTLSAARGQAEKPELR